MVQFITTLLCYLARVFMIWWIGFLIKIFDNGDISTLQLFVRYITIYLVLDYTGVFDAHNI